MRSGRCASPAPDTGSYGMRFSSVPCPRFSRMPGMPDVSRHEETASIAAGSSVRRPGSPGRHPSSSEEEVASSPPRERRPERGRPPMRTETNQSGTCSSRSPSKRNCLLSTPLRHMSQTKKLRHVPELRCERLRDRLLDDREPSDQRERFHLALRRVDDAHDREHDHRDHTEGKDDEPPENRDDGPDDLHENRRYEQR